MDGADPQPGLLQRPQYHMPGSLNGDLPSPSSWPPSSNSSRSANHMFHSNGSGELRTQRSGTVAGDAAGSRYEGENVFANSQPPQQPQPHQEQQRQQQQGVGALGMGSTSSGRSSPCTVDSLTSAMLSQDLLGSGIWNELQPANPNDLLNGLTAAAAAAAAAAISPSTSGASGPPDGALTAAPLQLGPHVAPPQQQQSIGRQQSGSSGGIGQPAPPLGPNRSPMSSIRRMYQYAASTTAGQPGGSGRSEGGPGPKRFNNVEEMVEIVRSLPPWASAVEAVAHSLYFLDNQAFAALLKALGKIGQATRAFELFDWVTKQIDEACDTRLAGLSDTYTYTTIISLSYGSRENCRRGMQYFAQMRQHNVPGNTFTYTALMSVCMKVNEAEAALDVYRGMLDAGLRPSAITYKIALDAYCRSELWDDAFAVFTEMQLKGLHVEERTYTLALMALGRTAAQPPASQCPTIALRLYKQLCSQLPSRLPGSSLHANTIKVFSRVGMWSPAMHFFRLIPRHDWSEPAVRDLAESFAVAGMATEAQQVLTLLPSCKQPPAVDTRGVCSSWNGHECFFQNLHGSCKYMHSHRPGRSNKLG